MEGCWLCIDESNNESVHQHEPHYNRLQKRWKSQGYIYVPNGLINILIPQQNIDSIDDSRIIAGGFEIIKFLNNKAHVREILKIYK